MLDPQKTPHTSPQWTNYEVSFVNICEQIDHVITPPHCTPQKLYTRLRVSCQFYPNRSGLLCWHWGNHSCPSANEATLKNIGVAISWRFSIMTASCMQIVEESSHSCPKIGKSRIILYPTSMVTTEEVKDSREAFTRLSKTLVMNHSPILSDREMVIYW